MLDFYDFIICSKQHLELLQGTVLQPIQVLQCVLANIKQFQTRKPKEPSPKVLVFGSRLAEKRFDLVVSKPQNFQIWQKAKAFKRNHLIVRKIQISQVRTRTLVKHVLKVSEFTVAEVELSHILQLPPV